MEVVLSQLYNLSDLSSHPYRYFLKLAISELSEGVQNGTKQHDICIKVSFFFFFNLVQTYSFLYLLAMQIRNRFNVGVFFTSTSLKDITNSDMNSVRRDF